MGKNLENAVKRVDVVQIVHHGDQLILPENMSAEGAVETLIRRMEYDKKMVQHERIYDVFPYDGAAALEAVLKDKFGWAEGVAIETMFGDIPPQFVTVEVGPRKTRQVPWGKFGLHGIKGELFTQVAMKDNRFCFKLKATIVRKDEGVVLSIFDAIEQHLAHHSLYRGKAISLRLFDDSGNPLEIPEIRFMDTDDVDENSLVYSEDVTNAIRTNLFTPIERVKDCIANNIPVKRGVLLGGPYGTGKTLAAKVAAKKANQHGVTFVYIKRASELAAALRFAAQYANTATSAVAIFCEDIDRETDGERDVDTDELLNTLDGIDTKSLNIITVLTTNHLDRVHKAMLRPGRLDAVIEVTPPDAEAAVRLVRVYGGDVIKPNADLTEVGEALAGTIPAVICEVVKRAKLAQLSLQKPGTKVTTISPESLLIASRTMNMQLRLLAGEQPRKSDAEEFGTAFKRLVWGGNGAATETDDGGLTADDRQAVHIIRRNTEDLKEMVAARA
jgi:hypothetical protein